MNIFKSDDSRKTAKEHIFQKRNLNLYLDLKNNDKLNHTACLNDKKIKKITNHSSLINLSHGFYDYFQNGKCRDICNNYLSTERVAFACIETGAKLIISSSTSVYGTKENIVSEDCSKTDLMPQSPYAKIKLKEEELISRLCKEKDLKAIICRLGTIFGISPGMRFHTAVNKFCWQAVMRQPLTVWSTALEQKRPYLDLHDASRVFSYIIRNNMFDSHIYNIITLNTTVREIIDMIRLYVPDINVTLVDNRAMNNLSFEVSREKFLKKGFDFSGDLQRCIIETLELISQKRLNHTL